MAHETTIRGALLHRLENLDPDVAERLASDFDAELIERRREAMSPTPIRWPHAAGMFAFTLSLAMLIAPTLSDADPSLSLGGFGLFAGLIAWISRWQRKRMLYDLLAVAAEDGSVPERIAG